jgi:hypothetical protein
MSATAGTTFGISAGVPATFDVAGYVALSFTPTAEITNFGPFGGQWNNETKNFVALKGTQKVKTNFDPGALDLDLDLNTDGAGQVLMKSAHKSTALYAIEITTPNGDIYYCQVLVNSFDVNLSGQGAKQTATSSLAVSTSITDVDWVESLAA